jgi:hypothetical protein
MNTAVRQAAYGFEARKICPAFRFPPLQLLLLAPKR